MRLKVRECPKCGGTDILEKDGTYVCMNCRTFFDDANEYKYTETKIIRDEAKLEEIRYEREKDKKVIRGAIIFFVALFLFILYFFFRAYIL